MANSKSRMTPAGVKSPLIALSRRQFVRMAALAASSVGMATAFSAPRPGLKSPNDKLDVGIIGCGNKGEHDSEGMSGENIIALCDVDETMLAKAAVKWPKARRYHDYRVMIEKEKTLDAVTVTTPDHHHGPAAMLAIKSGLNVYCQKPLTRTISEARALTRAAREYRVVTQMGNQGHCGEGNRRLCEMLWSGAIGPVREVHCWTNKANWPQGLTRPQSTDPVPASLDWDLWIGPAPMRPFVDHWPKEVRMQRGGVYHPFGWRGWWDTGCGALGDMGCHIVDGAYWALKLGAPDTVEVVESSPINSEMAPVSAVIRYAFPARGDMPPCTLTWHDGGRKPPCPPELLEDEEMEASGTLLLGDKGKIVTGQLGARPHLIPLSRMAAYKQPDPTIPRVQGPYQDFIRACKGGPPACSNFDVSGPFTEMVLLGNVALRAGKKIEWDSQNLRAKNCPEADAYIHAQFRKGWAV